MDLSVIPKLNASTYVAHGHLLERQGNFERAERQYREALKLTPNLTSARNRLGITLNKLGRHPEATAEFRTAAAQAPGSAHLLNNLGFSLHLEGKYEEAEEVLSQALGLRPTFRRARMNRALVLAKLGRYDDAFADFCLTGTEADAHYNLAVMQAESREYAEAAHSLERALTLNPEFADARQQLRQIARLAAQAEAEQMAAAELVALEEEAQLADMAEEVELVAIEETPAEILSARPPVAEDLASGEVLTAAGTEPVPTVEQTVPQGLMSLVTPEPLPLENRPTPAEAARMLVEIQVWIAAAEDLADSMAVMPEFARPVIDVDSRELAEMFDEFVRALLTDAPWWEASLCRLEEALDLLEENY